MHTSGMADDLAQGNLVALPEDGAYNFMPFCQRNPVPCPFPAVGDASDIPPPQLGTGIDLRSDLPRDRAWRHGERQCHVAMFKTHIATAPSGVFSGPLLVSMEPLSAADAISAVQITARFTAVHGAPIDIGDLAQFGIADLQRPHYSDPVKVLPGEVPVFGACDVTPQAALAQPGRRCASPMRPARC